MQKAYRATTKQDQKRKHPTNIIVKTLNKQNKVKTLKTVKAKNESHIKENLS